MSIPSWAKPGAKVVCVDSVSGNGQWAHGEAPENGRIYTISRVLICAVSDAACCEFVELKRSEEARADLGSSDIGYNLSRFRPLVANKRTAEQDVALFTHHLDTSKVSA